MFFVSHYWFPGVPDICLLRFYGKESINRSGCSGIDEIFIQALRSLSAELLSDNLGETIAVEETARGANF
jgi:hypothetical protein